MAADMAIRLDGSTLRGLRERMRLSQSSVAQSMGVSRTRVDNLEHLAAVPPAAAVRYVAALEALEALAEHYAPEEADA